MRTTRPAAEDTRQLNTLGGVDRSSRHNLGNINALAASMALEGLRHPVLVTPAGHVLKGSRRVAAARLLRWEGIQTRPVATVEDALEAIAGQHDETSKARTMSESCELGLAVELLDRRGRPRKGQPGYDTTYMVGTALFSSGSTYKRAKALFHAAHSQGTPAHVVDVAREALAEVDGGTLRVTSAYERVKEAERADPLDGLGADGLPLLAPPLGSARTPKARKLRGTWIKALAAKGATSAHIAEQLGLSVKGLKVIAADLGVVITADLALNKTQRRVADPNRAVRVAVADLDALVWSLDRTDPTTLDPVEATAWAQQLKEYARSIDRVARKIAKEHVR